MSLQVKVRHKQLTSVLSQVAGAAGNKHIPVLSAVRIEDNGQGIDVAATNMQVYMNRRVPAVVMGRGAVCVSARKLTQILRLIPKTADWIILEGVGEPNTPSLKVSWGNSEYVLCGFPPDTFPTKPNCETCELVMIVQTDVLQTMLKRAAWAAGTDESKPWLTGINLSVGEDKARVVATDGVCIGWADCDVTITGGTAASVTRIIPQETVKHLITLLPTTGEAAVEISVVEQQLFIYAGDLLVISNTLQGKYPDVMRLVPQQYPRTMTVTREEFLGVIKRLATLGKDGAFEMHTHPGTAMVVTAETPEVGKALERMPDVTADWTMKISFNSKFFLKLLPLWPTPVVVCEFDGPRNPARFRPDSDDSCGAVILPLITY